MSEAFLDIFEKKIVDRPTKDENNNQIPWLAGKCLRSVSAWIEEEDGTITTYGPWSRVTTWEEQGEEYLPSRFMRWT